MCEPNGIGRALEGDRVVGSGGYKFSFAGGFAGGGSLGEFLFEGNAPILFPGKANFIETASGGRFAIIVTDVKDAGIQFVVCGLVNDTI